MGDITTLNTITEDIKGRSDSCKLFSKQIVQMAEDFDLEAIQNWPMTWIHANCPDFLD